MKVMAVIHPGVDSRRSRRLDVGFVDFGGGFIRADSGVIVSGADVNMGRHMDDVPRRGRQGCQPIRAS